MPRKFLNIYLCPLSDNQLRVRLIEIQEIEESPSVSDAIVESLLGSCENTFALCLNEALDDFNYPHIVAQDLEYGSLLKRFCERYSREIIHDIDQPHIRHTYHDLDLLLYAAPKTTVGYNERGNDFDMLMQLGALDDALTAFRKDAINDGYDIAIQYCDETPAFTDKHSIIHDTISRSPADNKELLSRRVMNWIATSIQNTPALQANAACVDVANNLLAPLLKLNDKSLKSALREQIYPGQIAPPSPRMLIFFSSDIKPIERSQTEEVSRPKPSCW